MTENGEEQNHQSQDQQSLQQQQQSVEQQHQQFRSTSPTYHQTKSESSSSPVIASITGGDHNNSIHSSLPSNIDIEKGYHYVSGLNNNNNSSNNKITNNENAINEHSRSNGKSAPTSAPIKQSTSSFSSNGGENLFQQEYQNQQQQQFEKAKKSSGAAVICRVALITVGLVFLIAIVTSLWYYMGWMYGIPALLVAIATIVVSKVGWRWFYIAAVTTPRDLTGLIAYIKLLILVRRYQRKNVTISDIFQMHVASHPDKICIIYEDQEWTFRDVNEFSNRIANLFHSHGYKRGDVICLLLENRPEFIGTWLGLSKLGIITPLINTNQQGPSLIHSIVVAESNALIYGENYSKQIADISDELYKKVSTTFNLYQFNNEPNKSFNQFAKDMTTLLQNVSKIKEPANAEKADHHDKLLYIYTSGTTGLPKAAVISHSRYIFITAAIHYTLKFKTNDIFYTPLPLYHTAGGVMSVGQAIIFGATVVIRKKFSASSYFPDCKKYNCTIAQYIGEMCRYILATPPSPDDKSHNVRLMFGNGLRPQIWPQFVERFNIAKVGEFYGATEGNANIVNNDNTVGAIGFVSRIIPSIYPISIIRADPSTGEPIRDENGLCQLCKPNEPGVFIGKIIKGNPSREFLGYVDKKASEKKIVHDVFKKGDMAFLSGDLLIADERGYLFFKDRTGDTFRWKGENVSTTEVEAQVSNVANYCDSIVYGVEIPHTEGRAGMAAIYDQYNRINLDEFTENIKKLLPSYARPLFLRFLNEIDLTGTFKLRKVDLQKDGFNPNVIKDDKLYYLTSQGKYEPLTKEIYEKICRNEIRF